ncbi:MAG: hypothetical protein HY360_01005 [Verrucomicrobia bacterium]|nr:hypothetical protein [Verrucomicrobiota bacterium]
MKNRIIVLLVITWAFILVATTSWAQDGTPPQTQQTGEAQQRTLETGKDYRYAVPTEIREGVGKQPFLIRKKFFNVSLRESGNFTDNVYSLRDFKRSDIFNTLDFNVTGSLTLYQDWTVSARAGIRDFRYHRFGSLDFNSAAYTLTGNYNWQKWNWYLTLEHTDLYKRNFGDHFFQEDDVTFGGYYSHPLGRRALLYLGAQYTRQFTHPDSSSKHLPTVYLGLITLPVEDLPKLRLAFSASYSYADFVPTDREDHRYNVGPELSYEFFPWFNMGVGVGGGWGDSNQDAFDYEVFNATGFLKLNYQF